MQYIQHQSIDPYYNLALEEFFLKEADLDEDLFYLWRNQDSLILGRNQNPFFEINLPAAFQQKIPIIRRISGGGCVFHDLGNINFTYITNNFHGRVSQYEKVLQPVIKTLNQMGIEASFRAKSDLVIHDVKISGNAQSFHNHRLIHHGTLLFHTNLNRLSTLLHQHRQVKLDNAVMSNRSKVGNICEMVDNLTDPTEFMDHFMNVFESQLNEPFSKRSMTIAEVNRVQKIANEKYRTYEWNYGETGRFTKRIEVENLTQYEFVVEKGYLVEIIDLLDPLKTRILSHKIRFLPEEMTKLLENYEGNKAILEQLF